MAKRKSYFLRSLIAGVLAFFIVLAMYWVFNVIEERQLLNRLDVYAKQVELSIKTNLDDQGVGIKRMAHLWELRGRMSENTFTQSALYYKKRFNGLQLILWSDNDFHVQQAIPRLNKEKLAGLKIPFAEKHDPFYREAINTETPLLSKPIKAMSRNQIKILFLMPLEIDKQHEGFVIWVLNVKDWLNSILDENITIKDSNNFSVNIMIDGETVLQQQMKSHLSDSESASVDTDIINRKFTITLTPTLAYLASSKVLPVTPLFIFNLMFSLLVSIITYLIQKIYSEKAKAIISKHSLDNVIDTLEIATTTGHVGIWTYNPATNQFTLNDIMYDIYGFDKNDDITYERWLAALHPSDRKAVEDKMGLSISSEKNSDIEFRIILPNQEIRYLEGAARLRHDGKDMVITGTTVDATDHKLAEDRLSQEKEKLNNIIEGAEMGTWEWNIQNNKMSINARFAEMLGYTMEELQPISSETREKLCHPDDLGKSKSRIKDHLEGKVDAYECDVRMKHKKGEWVWVHDRGKVATKTENGSPLIMFGTHMDITDRKRQEEEAYRQANYDSLTGLATRRFVQDNLVLQIAKAKRNKEKIAVMFIDLDGFKLINDKYGHDAGDFLLQETAKRLTSCIRSSDVVARIGGDEFLVVLSDIQSRKNVELIAAKLISSLSHSVTFKDDKLQVGASVGIAIYPDDTVTCDELISLSDQAMYQVKKSGKNSYVFFSQVDK